MCLNMTVCVTGLAEFQLLRRRAAIVHAHRNASSMDTCTATAGVDLKGKVARDETGREEENGIGWPDARSDERGRAMFFSVNV